MANWVLYHTDGCHLCEQAAELVQPLLANDSLQLIDIMNDETLIVEYQVLIPVLKSPKGRRLFWPFSQKDVDQLINDNDKQQ